MKKLDCKSRAEQMFILFLLCAVCFGAFMLTGCGGGSCETIQCGIENDDDYWVGGCSIPGCGGCLSSESGCDSCLWPQSCKIVAGSESGSENEADNFTLAALDIRYYGDGCLGCGQREKTCYSSCITSKEDSNRMSGCIYGSSDTEEQFIGCFNGCFGCGGSEGVGAQSIRLMEWAIGIN